MAGHEITTYEGSQILTRNNRECKLLDTNLFHGAHFFLALRVMMARKKEDRVRDKAAQIVKPRTPRES